MDITKLTIEELKALAYDEMIKLNTAQQNIQLIQAEINKRIEKDNKLDIKVFNK